MSSDNCGLYYAFLFFSCKCSLSEMISPVVQTRMYAISTHVWYHSRSKGPLLLATVIGPSPSGPEFLHVQYPGTWWCKPPLPRGWDRHFVTVPPTHSIGGGGF